MAHHKRRKRKAFKGCCGLCACKDHTMGVRNKRTRTMQERRAGYQEHGNSALREQDVQ